MAYVRRPDGTIITTGVNKFETLLKKEYSSEDMNELWKILRDGALERDRALEGQGLINLLKEKTHISRMWEIAACKYSDYADLMGSNNAAVDAELPGTWIGKRGEKKGGHTLYFPWERSSNGFTLKEKFEMTISRQNAYSVDIGGIGDDKRNVPNILFSVERNPDRLHPLPDAVKSPVPGTNDPKSCVMAFTFGVAPNKIIVYIRFAGATILVGKAFKENWADEGEDKDLWGDLVLAKHKSN